MIQKSNVQNSVQFKTQNTQIKQPKVGSVTGSSISLNCQTVIRRFVLLFRILKRWQVKIQTTSKNCQGQYTTKGLIRDLLSNTLNCYVRAGEFREYLFTGNKRQKYAKRNGIGAITIFVHVFGVISVYLCSWIIILNVDSRDPMFSCLTFRSFMKRLLISYSHCFF